MVTVNNPLGENELNITEATQAERIGRRIRAIRTSRGLSQTQLGDMLGVPADQIQKYENGARNPRGDRLSHIASALGVNPLALADPTPSSNMNAMFALFELERNFNVTLEKHNRKVSITFDKNNPLYKYMYAWYSEYSKVQNATSNEEKDKLYKDYLNWQWTFPSDMTNMTETELKKLRIKQQIEELQAAYDELDNN